MVTSSDLMVAVPSLAIDPAPCRSVFLLPALSALFIQAAKSYMEGCLLLKLRQMGTQGVHMNGILPWLVRWARRASTFVLPWLL